MTTTRKRVVDLPLNLMYVNRATSLGRRFKCHYCGYPSATKRGKLMHIRKCHTENSTANRNWEIFYRYRYSRKSPVQLAKQFNLSVGSVYRIIQRGIAYPGIYELEGGFR